MERIKRVQEIDEMIAALKKEKESLQFHGHVLGGPNYRKLGKLMHGDINGEFAYPPTALDTMMSKFLRYITGEKTIAHHCLEPDRGEELQKMAEAISKAIIDSGYWEKYGRGPK